MGSTTPNLGLFKPALTDPIDIAADFNSNYDLIDTAVAGKAATGHTHSGAYVRSLGYAQVVASQAGITFEADLTGLAKAVTVEAGHSVRVTADVGVQRTVADGLLRLSIKEGATVLQFRDFDIKTAGVGRCAATWVGTPSAGAHTYKLSLNQVTGTGTSTVNADTTYPSFILVEDLGVMP